MPMKQSDQKADENEEMMIASNKCENSYHSCCHNKLLKMGIFFIFSSET